MLVKKYSIVAKTFTLQICSNAAIKVELLQGKCWCSFSKLFVRHVNTLQIWRRFQCQRGLDAVSVILSDSTGLNTAEIHRL